MISFIVPGIPVAQPRQRSRVRQNAGGKFFAQNYTPAKDPVNEFKERCRLAAIQAYRGHVLQSPIMLAMLFVFPRPGRLVWKTRPMPRLYMSSKPDWDNLGKSVSDALSGVLYRDDAQIVGSSVVKAYAAGDEQPHTEIVAQVLGDIEKTPNQPQMKDLFAGVE